MLEDPLVSIVLLNYNGRALSQYWESVFKESYANKEVIFVDNASVDGSAASFLALAAAYPQIRSRFIVLPENVGYSQGNNEGVKYAQGKFICLLGSDVAVDSNWIRPVLEAFESDPAIGCVLPAIFRMEDHTVPDRPWTEMDPFGFTHRLEATGAPVQPVFFAEGTSMFLRRSLLDRLGYLFPSEYFTMFEDVDFCWRARLQGFSSVVASQSRVFHVRGGTETGVLLKKNPRAIRSGTRNRLATMFTNYSTSHLGWFLPITFLMEIVMAGAFWARGMRFESRATLNGVAAFLRDIPTLRNRRAAVQGSRVASDKEILSQMADPIQAPKYLFGQWGELGRLRIGSLR
ncbi:MAG: glycosyltransferase family 2 protein [Thermoplasmata archaeon]|nr:glycosyltransferase family 2 protein [Thermoplasmata archaeon]